MKIRCWRGILILFLFLPIAYAKGMVIEPCALEYALYGTDYRLSLPEDWLVTTGTDPHQALINATSPDHTIQFLAFRNEQDGWHLDEWVQALTKASRQNGVENLEESKIGERQFVQYQLRIGNGNLPATVSLCAATEMQPGEFITFELRCLQEMAEEDLQVFFDTCLLPSFPGTP